MGIAPPTGRVGYPGGVIDSRASGAISARLFPLRERSYGIVLNGFPVPLFHFYEGFILIVLHLWTFPSRLLGRSVASLNSETKI